MVVGILVALLLFLDWVQRGRRRVVARQIVLTNALDAEMGAFRPWRVTFAVPCARADQVPRLIAITERVFMPEIRSAHSLQIRLHPVPASRV